MKKIQMFSLLSLLAFTLFTMHSSTHVAEAAYYGYINESGNLVYVDAATVSGAFLNSTNIADHSGVMLVNYIEPNTNQYIGGYMYVNEFGVVTRVVSNTVSGAFLNSTNIADHSGVMIIDSIKDSNTAGDTVSGI
jgi:hypothetical protein